MNAHLNNATLAIAKAESLCYVIERLFVGKCTDSICGEFLEHAENTFYCLWDEIKSIGQYIERLCEDEQVVDVISAVEKSRERTLSNV